MVSESVWYETQNEDSAETIKQYCFIVCNVNLIRSDCLYHLFMTKQLTQPIHKDIENSVNKYIAIIVIQY